MLSLLKIDKRTSAGQTNERQTNNTQTGYGWVFTRPAEFYRPATNWMTGHFWTDEQRHSDINGTDGQCRTGGQ